MPNADGFNPTAAIAFRYGRQSARGVDPTVWQQAFVNAAPTFGKEDEKRARRYFNEGGQRGPANLIDRISRASLNLDLTKIETSELYQSLFFAVCHQKGATQPFNGTQIAISAVDGANDQYETAGDFTVAPNLFRAGDLILASGFNVAANNGLKTASAVAATAIDVDEDLTAEASPPAAAKLEVVGFQFASDDCTLTNPGTSYPVLGATAKNLTQLGLTPGEWIIIGGDSAAFQFGTAANNCWARVLSVSATQIVLDKTSATIVTDAGAGKTIQIFLPRLFRNEVTLALRTQVLFQLERLLGSDGSGTIAQYVTDAIAGKGVITIDRSEGKATLDLDFLGSLSPIQTGVKTGSRPSLTPDEFVNTTTNIVRTKLAAYSATDANPSSLSRFAEKIEITIDSNPQPVQVVGSLAPVGAVQDLFGVDARLDGLLDRTDIQTASDNNTRCTFDALIYQSNGGIALDGPACRVNAPTIEGEEGPNPIREPIELAFEDSTGFGPGNTFSLSQFPYAPAHAASV